jgi:hypothetical protein
MPPKSSKGAFPRAAIILYQTFADNLVAGAVADPVLVLP